MKSLLYIFLGLSLVFGCSDDSNEMLKDRIIGKYFIYQGFSNEIAVNKPMLNGGSLHHRWQFFEDQDCFIFTGDVNYTLNSSSEDVISLNVGPYYVSYRLIDENPLTLAYAYGGGQVVMEEISLTELGNLISLKTEGCCNTNITCPTD